MVYIRNIWGGGFTGVEHNWKIYSNYMDIPGICFIAEERGERKAWGYAGIQMWSPDIAK